MTLTTKKVCAYMNAVTPEKQQEVLDFIMSKYPSETDIDTNDFDTLTAEDVIDIIETQIEFSNGETIKRDEVVSKYGLGGLQKPLI